MGFFAVLSTITVSSRSLRTQAKYLRFRKAGAKSTCNMCLLANSTSAQNSHEQIIWRGKYNYVTKNLFPYALWDGAIAVEHLILMPNRHTQSLRTFTTDEMMEWATIIAEYESKNYSIYARSAGNTAKSIEHKHTHLIQVKNRPKHFRRIKHGLHVVFGGR